MTKQAVAGRFVTAVDTAEVDEEKKVKRICLCGKTSPHARRTDCIVGPPGTPWWEAFSDAEKGDDVEVSLPNGNTVKMQVMEVELIKIDTAA